LYEITDERLKIS